MTTALQKARGGAVREPPLPNLSSHGRRSIRLAGHDYSKAGAYFVTICTHNRQLWLENSEVRRIVEATWVWLETHHDYVRLDQFAVMPNHLHGIIFIIDNRRGGSRTAPTERKPLGRLVGAFKAVSTKIIRQSGHPYFHWQRNYYERIIRNEDELDRIRQYIIENPLKWDLDEYNTSRGR